MMTTPMIGDVMVPEQDSTTVEQQKPRTLVNVGAVWAKLTRDGQRFFSGYITLPDGSRAAISIFENTSADVNRPLRGPRRPDYIVYMPVAEVTTDEPF